MIFVQHLASCAQGCLHDGICAPHLKTFLCASWQENVHTRVAMEECTK